MRTDEFYAGFVAEHYDLLVPEDEAKSYGFFRSVIERQGQPALELACGTGRPLLSFVADGLDVEGLDSSSDMLRRCRAKASARNLSVTLHHQRMESFSIERSFRTIYCVSSSFMLLATDDLAGQALASIHRHLEPGGTILVALHLPDDGSEVSGTEWRVAREATAPADGSTIRCSSRLLAVDHAARTYATRLRYESIEAAQVRHQEDRDFLLHWYSREQFTQLLEAAGYVDVLMFRGNGKPSQPSDLVFIVSASRAPAQ